MSSLIGERNNSGVQGSWEGEIIEGLGQLPYELNAQWRSRPRPNMQISDPKNR